MFKRMGTPEPINVLKFRCNHCGQEVVTVTNGVCLTCQTQLPKPSEPLKEEDILKVQKESLKEK